MRCEGSLRRQTQIGLLSMGFVVATTSLLAEKDVFEPSNDVSFSISTAQTSYKAGEVVIVNYRIVNVSNAPLYVPRGWEVKCPARPHVSVWFENEAGEHAKTGYGGSCFPSAMPKTVVERMAKEAVLLKPGEHFDGTYPVDTGTFEFLKPGAYRFEASLSCWREEEFSAQEQAQLATMRWPFVRGDVPASINVVLTSH
jgi:hypothetical protein